MGSSKHGSPWNYETPPYTWWARYFGVNHKIQKIITLHVKDNIDGLAPCNQVVSLVNTADNSTFHNAHLPSRGWESREGVSIQRCARTSSSLGSHCENWELYLWMNLPIPIETNWKAHIFTVPFGSPSSLTSLYICIPAKIYSHWFHHFLPQTLSWCLPNIKLLFYFYLFYTCKA